MIRNASSNYMVQDLCFYLQKLGVEIEGVGTTTLRITGVASIDVTSNYSPSEDPIEAMSLLAAAIVTKSEITIRRVPIEFLELELAILGGDGLPLRPPPRSTSPTTARSRLVDLTTHPSELHAPLDKIHPMPFRASTSTTCVLRGDRGGRRRQTLLHDWVYENRAIYLTELNKLGAQVKLLDPHRVLVEGRRTSPAPRSSARCAATRGRAADRDARLEGPQRAALDVRHPPRLRGPGRARLNELGANIETFRDI